MIRDFDIKERVKAEKRKRYKSIFRRNKEYKMKMKQMKEQIEENFDKRNKSIEDKILKKNDIYMTQLKEQQVSKVENKKRSIEILMEKEEKAKEQVLINLEEQERKRLKNAEEINKKSK